MTTPEALEPRALSDERLAEIQGAAMNFRMPPNLSLPELVYMVREIQSIRALSSAPPATGEVACDDCGEPYASPRFPDLVLPHDVWKVIAPNDAMLCPNCICARLEKSGLSGVSSKFTSGPLAIYHPTTGEAGEAERHLGNVLMVLADLHADDRCRALDEALAFYNVRHPEDQVRGEEGYTSRLVVESPLSRALTDAGPAAAEGWRPIETAPHACHVLATRWDEAIGEWIIDVVLSPPSQPLTHWMPLPASPKPAQGV